MREDHHFPLSPVTSCGCLKHCINRPPFSNLSCHIMWVSETLYQPTTIFPSLLCLSWLGLCHNTLTPARTPKLHWMLLCAAQLRAWPLSPKVSSMHDRIHYPQWTYTGPKTVWHGNKKNGHRRGPLALWNVPVNVQMHTAGDPQNKAIIKPHGHLKFCVKLTTTCCSSFHFTWPSEVLYQTDHHLLLFVLPHMAIWSAVPNWTLLVALCVTSCGHLKCCPKLTTAYHITSLITTKVQLPQAHQTWDFVWHFMEQFANYINICSG